MPMPETTVNKNDLLVLRQYNVGFSRHVGPILPETKSESVYDGPDKYFRFSVLALHAAHYEASLVSFKRIQNGLNP